MNNINRKLENRIIEFAFGELDKRHIASVEHLIATDDDAKRVYEQYADMAHGIRNQPPVPEPSLLTERLRQRILTETTKEPSSGWAWALPATAGTLVIAVIAVSMLQSGEPTPVPEPDKIVENSLELDDLPMPHEWVPSMLTDVEQESELDSTDRQTPPETVSQPSNTINRDSAMPVDTNASIDNPIIVIEATGSSATEMRLPDGMALGG